jgi:GNAT superfamily N-acetyltransferase
MQTASALAIRRLQGAGIHPHLEDAARLRLAVFGEWPYLYAGDMDYERGYLAAYGRSADSVFVLAFEGDAVVGVSTGLPLADDDAAFQAPFRERGMDVDRVFYFGESVLLPHCRGRGVGHAFFDQREAHARSLGRFSTTAFCAVDRDPSDPRRPPGHRGNERFWAGRGYAPQPGMRVRLAWEEAGVGRVEHALTFWTRPLEPAATATPGNGGAAPGVRR